MRFLSKILCLLLLTNCASQQRTPERYQLSPDEGDFIALSSYLVADSIDYELLEWAIFHETNRQRERLGLIPFKFDPGLRSAALQHSKEMAELNYFEHESPVADYKTIKQRMQLAGIKRGVSGENIAFQGTNDFSEYTNFYLDDVSFWTYCGGLTQTGQATGQPELSLQKIEMPPGFTLNRAAIPKGQ